MPISVPYHYQDAGTSVTLPTSFTPNGDGKNDLFRTIVYGAPLQQYQMIIRSSSGTEVFRTSTPENGWDSYDQVNNRYYPAGNYRIDLSFKTTGSAQVTQTLYFTIMSYNAASDCWNNNGKEYFFEDQLEPSTGTISRPTAENEYCPQ